MLAAQFSLDDGMRFMPCSGKRWWHISARELAYMAGILAFEVAILLPAVLSARASAKRPKAPQLSPTELGMLRLMDRVGYHGWVAVLGAVLCGASVAALGLLVAAFLRRRSKGA